MSVETTVLENGLRVITEEIPFLETSSVGVWVDVGARNETAAENGISHMLEHMAFKGTERRSAIDIALEIESTGGSVNAYTSRENTAYFARVLREHVPLAIDILADILQNSTFVEAELEREREVIVQEIGQALDTPDDVVFDNFQLTAYPNQAVGRSILGSVEHVTGFNRNDLAGYMDVHYRAPQMVLVATGAVKHGEVVELAQAHFGAIGSGSKASPEPALYTGGDSREERELEQAHLLLGLRGVPFGDPDYYAYQVANVVLGGGMSSRLFQEVRERRGLAYAVYSFSSSLMDSGVFGMYAGTGPHALDELVPVLVGELEGLANNASAEETDRARAQIKAGVLMSLESSSSRCEQLGRQMQIYGRTIPVEEVIARIEEIDEHAVRHVAESLLGQGPATVAAIGPVEALADYETIAARFGS